MTVAEIIDLLHVEDIAMAANEAMRIVDEKQLSGYAGVSLDAVIRHERTREFRRQLRRIYSERSS